MKNVLCQIRSLRGVGAKTSTTPPLCLPLYVMHSSRILHITKRKNLDIQESRSCNWAGTIRWVDLLTFSNKLEDILQNNYIHIYVHPKDTSYTIISLVHSKFKASELLVNPPHSRTPLGPSKIGKKIIISHPIREKYERCLTVHMVSWKNFSLNLYTLLI